MLLKRQAPGRDFHKHFSLAPARGDTNPKQPAIRPRSQSPTRQGSSSQCDVESTTPVTHLSRSPRPIPLAPSHLRPTPFPSRRTPNTSNHEWTQTVKGGETPPACAPPLSGAWAGLL